MRIVEPWIKVEKIDGKKIMKRLERACRTCYRSEGKITDDSYKKLLTNCITRGHESVLEHEKVTVRIYDDVGSYKDLTRHRFASFSVESTRYCSYDKDKYGNEIAFINPSYIEDKFGEVVVSHRGDRFCFTVSDKASEYVHNNMKDNEFIKALIELVGRHGCTMDEIKELFDSYSDKIVTEAMDNGEFDIMMRFDDGSDPYYYCFKDEGCHIIYHRFLPEDYADFGF